MEEEEEEEEVVEGEVEEADPGLVREMKQAAQLQEPRMHCALDPICCFHNTKLSLPRLKHLKEFFSTFRTYHKMPNFH